MGVPFKIVSAESLLHVEHQHSSADVPVSKLVKQSAWTKVDVLVLTILWEAVRTTNWHSYLEQVINGIRKSNPTVKIILVINSWYRCQELKLKKLDINEFVFVDFFMLLAYIRLMLNRESEVSDGWDKNTKKFLFLTGKPQKINRIRLFYHLVKAGIIDQCVWSLFVHNKKLEQACHELIPELSVKEFDKFVQRYNTSPDRIFPVLQADSFHYSGIPYDTDIYKNSLFQVISETDFYSDSQYPWLTEKTWISIFNRMPFIIAGEPNSLSKLRQMGFNTFENYLPVTDYDQINEGEKRLAAIVTNAKYLLTNIEKHADLISIDIEHNFNHMLTLAENNLSKIKCIINTYNLTCTFNDIIGMSDRRIKQ